jgi:hypothetical protein
MDFATFDPQKRTEQILQRIDELRSQLHSANPAELSSRTGIPFDRLDSTGFFKFQFWQYPLNLAFPSLELSQIGQDQAPNPLIQAMVFYYFNMADGKPLSHRWIAFSELPNGIFYNQAFQGYTGQVIARTFKNDFARFSISAKQLGGKKESFGDAAFRFQILPRIPLLVTGWQGDEDFPASFKILFDASISHYLPTDACAIAGSMLTGMLVKSVE